MTKEIKEQPTRIIKSFHGWTGQSVKTFNGQTYKIITMKRHSGQIISKATPGKVEANGNVLIFTHHAAPIILKASESRATRKKIKTQHAEAIEIFEAKIKERQPTA